MFPLLLLTAVAHASEPSTCTVLVTDGDATTTVTSVDMATGAVTGDGVGLAVADTKIRGLSADATSAWVCSDGALRIYDRTTGALDSTGRACTNVAFGSSLLVLARAGTPAATYASLDDVADPEVEPDVAPRLGTARVGASNGTVLWTAWGTGAVIRTWSTETWEPIGNLTLDGVTGRVWGMYASPATFYVLDDGLSSEGVEGPAIRAFDASTGEAGAVVSLDVDADMFVRGLWCDAP